MLNSLITGAIFAGLNGLGMWYSVPLTGINPSSSIWWRGFNSLEIAYSIHKLREIHPFIFPNNDEISKEDLLLQYSLDLEQYETARLALERSAQAASMDTGLPGGTMANTRPNSFFLGDGAAVELSYKQPQISNTPPSNNSSYSALVVVIVLCILAVQVKNFDMTWNLKKHINNIHYLFSEMVYVQRHVGKLLNELEPFRADMERVRLMLDDMAEKIGYYSTDLQRCLIHLVAVMEEKYSAGMIDMESKMEGVSDQLAEVSQQQRGILRNTESFPQIPKQLAWLNILIAKTSPHSSPMPEELNIVKPDMDPMQSPSGLQRNGGLTSDGGKFKTLSHREEVLARDATLKQARSRGSAQW